MPAQHYTAVAVFTLVGIAFVVLTLGFSWLVREKPKRYAVEKGQPYECGEGPIGEAWSQYYVRYYIFALIFAVFDVEIAFIAPWAILLRNPPSMLSGTFLFMEGLVFILILVVGLFYAWKKDVLRWM